MRRFDSCYRNIRLYEVDIDFPNVVSNGSVSADIATTQSFPLGTHIITFGFNDADAVDIDDMMIQFYFVNVDTLRYTLFNPTGGAINPGIITCQFVVGEFNSDLLETI